MSNDFYTLSETLSKLVNDLNQDNLDELSKKRWSKAELSEARKILSDRKVDLNFLFRDLLNTRLETNSDSDSTQKSFHNSTQYVPLYCRLIEDKSEDVEDGSDNSYYIEAFTQEMIDVNCVYLISKELIKTTHKIAADEVVLNISILCSKEKHYVEVYRQNNKEDAVNITRQHIERAEKNVNKISCNFNISNNDNFDVYVSVDETYSERILSIKNGKIIKNKKNYSYLDLLYKPYSFAISTDIPKEILGEIRKTNGMFVLKARMLNRTSPDTDSKPGHLYCAASRETHDDIEIKWTKNIFAISTGIERKIQQIKSCLDNIFQKRKVVDYSQKNKSQTISRGTDKDVLSTLFTDVSTSTVQVRCVGQANAIIIENKYINGKSKTFAFDLGLPWYDNREKDSTKTHVNTKPLYQFGHEDLSRLDLDYVFISHWHVDHYLGLYSLDRDFFVGTAAKEKGLVIAPYIEKADDITEQAKLMLCYLIDNDLIRFVYASPNSIRQIYNTDNCKLYFVNCPLDKGNGETDINSVSLVLWMKYTLFPGDCFIGSLPPAIQRLIIERMIIPHHGSLNGNSMIPLGKNTLNATCPGKTAYVCVGNHLQSWKHPEPLVINMYKSAFDKVYRTDGDPSNSNPVVESRIEDNFTFTLKW